MKTIKFNILYLVAICGMLSLSCQSIKQDDYKADEKQLYVRINPLNDAWKMINANEICYVTLWKEAPEIISKFPGFKSYSIIDNKNILDTFSKVLNNEGLVTAIVDKERADKPCFVLSLADTNYGAQISVSVLYFYGDIKDPQMPIPRKEALIIDSSFFVDYSWVLKNQDKICKVIIDYIKKGSVKEIVMIR